MNTSRSTSTGLGWRPDLPDHRDIAYAPAAKTLPDHVDLRASGLLPPVYDQGHLGSCTANAICAAIEFLQAKQGATPVMPSRLFVYFNERQIEGTVLSDAGASIRDGIKAVAKLGACSEELWPYEVASFAIQPPAACYADATHDLVGQYRRIPQRNTAMLDCLAQGFPFVLGFTAYQSLMAPQVAATGDIPMPGLSEQPIGGHAVLAVGYDATRRVFLVRNSWGTAWGDQGYGSIPFTYLTHPHLAADFWTLRHVGQ